MSTSPTTTPAPDATEERAPALSPSRAIDFKQCPLKYRFRAVDRIPERPSRYAVRGTVVHAVLESLYELPSSERDVERAAALVAPTWARLLAQEPRLAEVLDDGDTDSFVAEADRLVRGYYRLEDPTAFDPQSREELVEATTADGTPLRGYVDRIDVAPTGQLRIVDYKTGRTPSTEREGAALFQLKFYALILLRSRGILADQLRLLYLADGEILTYAPDRTELLRFEQILAALWRAVSAARESGDFPPNPGTYCRFCDFQPLCPAFGGTTPPYPAQ
ncbi:RecB family exonuclease [Nocardia stercoris]|uniref:RecB family exonuclease n=1 Tax=Nocardia stercoris TaxID=2483361 RepID=A0A3M2L3R8_9NOCA|nr:RecB family exonuclease [Nocardia stercoris]RMI32297.1 RecB family exonuclease [Nocardia stercoris]